MSEEGSEDSPVRSRRKIRKAVLFSSASESDSDDSVGVAVTRRKRLRVMSDDDGSSSSSSGSSVGLGGTLRRRTLPKLRDSDEESDTSGWATDHSDATKPATAVHSEKAVSGFASDSSEGNSDKCSICLLRFTNQEVGTPENCEHIFCLDCIMEWSKNVNTCPVDRMTFNFIVVRACAGGRILRLEPVKVVERSPSVEMIVIEDVTACEVCARADNEETMLLCDGCDRGYHMHCLTPPLTEIPVNQWICPHCDDLFDFINISEVDELYSGIDDLEMPVGPRPTPLRQPRNTRRSTRNQNAIDEPSTSSGYRNRSNHNELPSTSRVSRTSRNSHSTRRSTGPQRKRRKTRRSKTVIIEYEIQDNGKFPITRTVKRRTKKRRTKRRQPRTAARRSHVRASVRATLARMVTNQHSEPVHSTTSRSLDLSVQRQRAGIVSLSLFGNNNQLEYFTDDEEQGVNISNGPMSAVAMRPTSNILNAYRQARRKMISIPSPPHASSAPDILSDIMESQTLLHSKNSIVSISVDGNVDIKLQPKRQQAPIKQNAKQSGERLDLSKGEDAAKKAPSHPGQSRGGGWGGGYRGNYHREQNVNNLNRGYEGGYDGGYGGGYQGRQLNANYQNNMRRDDADGYGNYARRQPQYSHNDDSYSDRSRRQPPNESNRPNYALHHQQQQQQQQQQQHQQHQHQHHQRPNEQNQGRYSLGTSWQPYSIGAPGPRPDNHMLQNRHSFGGFENPLDMRMGQAPPPVALINCNSDMFNSTDAPIVDKSHTGSYKPLPEPPVFSFSKSAEVEKSEDERSDSGLVIDTEKYDPTEPTNDDDSCDEGHDATLPSVAEQSPPPTPDAVQNILAGIDTSTINVPPNILDSAVRQVLKEHRNLIVSPSVQHDAPHQNDKSDEESDGDCPNFSIYSATSVHIANNSSNMTENVTKEVPQDNLEDLVQEDDDVSPAAVTPPNESINLEATNNKANVDASELNSKPNYSTFDNNVKKKTEDEYKEKISKRCPITTNTRNPIKIKLNTHSLIKRQLTLYDDEDTSEEIELAEKAETGSDLLHEKKPSDSTKSPEQKQEFDSITKSPDRKQESPVEKEIKSENNVSTENSDKDVFDNKQTEENIKLDDSSMKAHSIKDEKQENSLSATDIETKGNDEPVDPQAIEYNKLEREEDDGNTKRKSGISDNEMHSEEDNDTDDELCINTESPKKDSVDKDEKGVEKMTESISETEDERSYTPCLDENKSKDTSLEFEKDKGLEGLDTEMISEDEGNEMFSENEKAPSEASNTSPVMEKPISSNEGRVLAAKKKENKGDDRDDTKKKKKKESSKKDTRDKNKNKSRKSEISFKKLSKNGKERNYRERDKEDKSKSKKERRESSETPEEKQKRRKEKRKDLERYDVRTVVSEKRKKLKDPFGRDISPGMRSTSMSPLGDMSPTRVRRSFSRGRRSVSKGRKSPSRIKRSISRGRKSPSRSRRSVSRGKNSITRSRRSPSRSRKSLSRGRRLHSPVRKSPVRMRRSPSRDRGSPVRGRRSPSKGRASQLRLRKSISRGRRSASSVVVRRARVSLSPRSVTPRMSPRREPERKRRRSISPRRRASPRRRRSVSRGRKRRRSASRSPKPKPTKKKKRSRSERPTSRHRSPRQKSPKRKKNKRHTISRSPDPEPLRVAPEWSPPSVDSRLLSPRTPPPDLSPDPCQLRVVVAADDKRKRKEKRRRDPDRQRHKRVRDAVGPSKEVFTSGDNILVSVSFKDHEDRDEASEKRKRREMKREKRKRKRAAVAPEAETAKPVAIIDLERSPFRELTPSPKNVIVLSDSEHGDKEAAEAFERPTVEAEAPPPAPEVPPPAPPAGPKTPPEPEAAPEPAAPSPPSAGSAASARSPDAYDPFEPTRSPSASPGAGSVPRSMTLEAAQRTNLSADEVLSRRPLSPMEKVLALLQSTRDEAPEPPPGADSEQPPPRILLPEPKAKLFVGKAEPIKSQPVKPMMARREDEPDDSPYSPGSSDFGDLFEPPSSAAKPPAPPPKRDVFDVLFDKPPKQRKSKSSAKVPVKLNKKRGFKTQVGVKIDEDNLKILDDLPSSAVEMQVKSKFLKKLNRQERVVEEVKLVLKPHYNKKHVTKEEYKDILRRAVPKICHNKSGEINPTKIQALVEAYVKKFRKKHKLGLV